MLKEIIGAAIAPEPEIRIVPGAPGMARLGNYTRRRKIDAVIFTAENPHFQDEKIAGVLRMNPHLRLLAVDGRENRIIVHFLAPARTVFSSLEASTLTAALRAGTGRELG
jgi:hypothetical protein